MGTLAPRAEARRQSGYENLETKQATGKGPMAGAVALIGRQPRE